MQSVNVAKPTRYAYILYYQVSNNCFFEKKARKNNLMETKTFEHQTKTQKVHTYEKKDLYPFAILEETTCEEGQEQTTYTPILGNKRCDEKVFDNLFECEEYIVNKPYSLIIALFLHTMELLETYKAEQQQLKPQDNETK